MKRILIATDFSDSAQKAMDYALQCFSGHRVTYHLIYVSECKSASKTTNGIATPCSGTTCDLKRQMLQQAAKNLNSKLDLKLQQCIPFYKNQTKIEAFRKHVAEHQIDLIVIGSKGQTNNPKAALGDFARDIITRVQCSFLIVPEAVKQVPPEHLLFPTNYTNTYHNVSLEILADFQATANTTLDVLYYAKHKRKLNETQIDNKELLEDFLEDSAHKSHKVHHENLELALSQYVVKSPADVLILMAKNRSFCENLLQRDSAPQRDLIKQTPILLLHE